MIVTAEIPDELVPWISEALGEAYPLIATGRTPSETVKGVILAWVQSALISHATEKARQAGDEAVRAAEEARDAAAARALREAQAAAARLAIDVGTELIDDPEEPPVEEEPPAEPSTTD